MQRRKFLLSSASAGAGLIVAPTAMFAKNSFENVGLESWSGPDSALSTLCITQSDLSIDWHLNKFYPGEKSAFSRLGSREIDGRHFDVYEGKAGSTNREYWMDVSYWYGRGLDMSPKRSLPPPGEIKTVLDFFAGPSASNFPLTSEQLEASRDFLSQFEVRFATWSSNQFSHAVATPPLVAGESPTIFATAVRKYIDEDLPFLHGFRFIAPFVAHQIYHLLIGEISDYHTELKADYYRPEPGVECIDFDWLPSDSPANDFWNYMLTAHKPGAFSVDGEKYALIFSINSIISDGYVSGDELYQALQKMRIAEADKKPLLEFFDDA